MKMLIATAAVVMAVCGVFMVIGVGKSNVWMGVAIIALGFGLVGYSAVKSKPGGGGRTE